MIGEAIVRQAATRKNYQGSLFELYAWFFMRVSGTILLLIVSLHLMYMHFIIYVEGCGYGVACISHSTIVGRWTDPVWGTAWRAFDLMLLFFSLIHGTNGVRYVIEDYVHSDGWRAFIKTLLYIISFVLLIMGSYIIFSFKTTI